MRRDRPRGCDARQPARAHLERSGQSGGTASWRRLRQTETARDNGERFEKGTREDYRGGARSGGRPIRESEGSGSMWVRSAVSTPRAATGVKRVLSASSSSSSCRLRRSLAGVLGRLRDDHPVDRAGAAASAARRQWSSGANHLSTTARCVPAATSAASRPRPTRPAAAWPATTARRYAADSAGRCHAEATRRQERRVERRAPSAGWSSHKLE